MKGDDKIADHKKISIFFAKLLQEYRSSLKPRETEEIVNQFFNRQLAFFTAKFFYKLKRSPNFVTLISMLFGVTSGFLFATGEHSYVMAGAVLLQLMIIFDCADGQLARMTGKSSRFGKTLDGLADLTTHISIFYGVAFAVYIRSGTIYPFFLGLVAQSSMYIHIILFDHFKNVFINVSKPDYADKLEGMEEMGEPSLKEKGNSGSFSLKQLVARLYYFFYRIEACIVSIGYLPFANNFYDLFPDPGRIDSQTREIYYREMRASMKIWTFLGDTTHLTIFVVLGLLNRITLILPVIIIFTNLYMIFAIVYQRVKFKNLGLEREILWQERFD